MPAGRLVETGEDVHQGRLARARRAHDRGEAAALEAGADLDQGVDRGVSLAVAAGDALATTTCPFERSSAHRIDRYPTDRGAIACAAWRWRTNSMGSWSTSTGSSGSGGAGARRRRRRCATLIEGGKEIVFVTNNPARPPAAYVERLRERASTVGRRAGRHRRAWSTARLAAEAAAPGGERLRDRRPGFKDTVAATGAGAARGRGGARGRRGARLRPPRVRLRGAADRDAAPCSAALRCSRPAATRRCRCPAATWPGTGAILAAVETASGAHGRDRRQARAAPLRAGAGR